MATGAPQYKAYKVNLLKKVRTNTSVQLGISLDRIEIEPLVTHKHAFWVNNLITYLFLYILFYKFVLENFQSKNMCKHYFILFHTSKSIQEYSDNIIWRTLFLLKCFR